MRLIWCLCCITDWLQQSQTLSVSSQSSGSTKCSLCPSQALQHMIKLGVYKPFKAGEIRIRFLGLQLTCSAETMEKSSEGTCSKCGIYRHNGNWPAAAKTNHSWAVKWQYQQWWISPFDTFSIPCQAPSFSFSPPSLLLSLPSQQAGMMAGCPVDVPLCLLCSEHKLSAAQMASFVSVQQGRAILHLPSATALLNWTNKDEPQQKAM